MVIFLKNGALKYLFKNMLYKIINTGRGAGGGGVAQEVSRSVNQPSRQYSCPQGAERPVGEGIRGAVREEDKSHKWNLSGEEPPWPPGFLCLSLMSSDHGCL